MSSVRGRAAGLAEGPDQGVQGTKGKWVRVGSLEELRARGSLTVRGPKGAGRVAVFLHDDEVYAVDNRCPHMGFPLDRGTVQDGILTCHWHHARFDLESGGTFDPFADDVLTYPVEVRDGEIHVGEPPATDAVAHWKARLQAGMEREIGLVIAKSIIALLDLGEPPAGIVAVGAEFGARYRREGFGSSLTILTAMANLVDRLPREEKILALYQGMLRVSRECAGEPPRFMLDPLPGSEGASVATLNRWFRCFVEVRDADGAERCLLTAVRRGATPGEMADMLFAAATDHFFLDGGHTLDFTNKAFELLDHVGWERAEEVLSSVVGGMCRADRAEESASWRHPDDLVGPLAASFDELSELPAEGEGKHWDGAGELTRQLLADDPATVVEGLRDAVRGGAHPEQLGKSLAYAAAMRVAHFHMQNEFGDWITVLHTFTYCHALHQALRRTRDVDVLRGVFHGAMANFLNRFLNVPPARLPDVSEGPNEADFAGEAQAGYEVADGGDQGGGDPIVQPFVDACNEQQQVERAAKIAAEYLTGAAQSNRGERRPSGGRATGEGDIEPLVRAFARALVREDADFHTFQMVEAGVKEYEGRRGTEQGRQILLSVARYVAAHSPTQREIAQTAHIAMRLHRGEALYAG